MPVIKLRSKNPSAADLRTRLAGVRTVKSYVVRLGSRTPLSTFKNPVYRGAMEINTIESIENSRSKLRMKNCFAAEVVRQSNWWEFRGNNTSQMRVIDPTINFDGHPHDSIVEASTLPYPIVVKQICGFKGHGMVKCETEAELNVWLANHNPTGYYIEEFKNFAKEYRLHATQNEVILSWRKLRRADAAERWFFNSSNCNWVNEEHEMFAKPACWNLMCEHAIRAIRATGLSIGAVDVRVKSGGNKLEDFIVLEVNSAPELGEVGTEAYFNVITKMIKEYEAN
jgi:carbamoylphosphate synthase large subunit